MKSLHIVLAVLAMGCVSYTPSTLTYASETPAKCERHHRCHTHHRNCCKDKQTCHTKCGHCTRHTTKSCEKKNRPAKEIREH